MGKTLYINNLKVQVDETPYAKSIMNVINDENEFRVLCPENTSDEDVVQYIYNNHHELLVFEEEKNQSEQVSQIEKESGEENEKESTGGNNSDPMIMEIIESLVIKTNPKIKRIRFSYNPHSQFIILHCPIDIDELALLVYLQKHKHEIISTLRSKKDKKSVSLTSVKKYKEKHNKTKDVTTTNKASESISKKKTAIDVIFEVEGYRVYRLLDLEYRDSIFAKIVDRNRIYVQVSKNHYNDISFIRNYVEEKLNKLISDHESFIKKSHLQSTSRYIEKGTYSYLNRRSDITDEEPLKILKRKLKSYITDPAKTQGYIGEVRINLIGMRAIGSDGRLTTIQRAEDYGLIDKND